MYNLAINLIVKDEAHIIQETLECVRKYIDYWVIVDTGSTDDTMKIIQDYFDKYNVPGELHERKWVNFGHNRTEALQLCKGKVKYAWVIDADDTIEGTINLTNLMADQYLLKYGTEFFYWRGQIFNMQYDWEYVGVLHEYPRCTSKDSVVTQKIEGDYHINSRRLGNRNKIENKYKRDIEILLKGLNEEPNNDRYIFYLAQSYFDDKQYEKAIEYYQKRFDMQGWYEECYYSLYKIGMATLYLQKSDFEIINAFVKAYNYYPKRAEPLYELAKHFRQKDMFDLSYHFAKLGLMIPFPEQDKLFITKAVYDYMLLDEFSIVSYYVGKYEECYNAYNKLLKEHKYPIYLKDRIEQNRIFAIDKLQDKFNYYDKTIVNSINSKNTKGIVTFTITTCKRLNLFCQTMDSFLHCCQDLNMIRQWICVDDNSSPEDRAIMKKKYPFFKFIWKSEDQKGHAKSMNIILDKVKTPYWMHMEDDWKFVEKKHFIKEAINILKENDYIAQVVINRNYAETISNRCINILHGPVKKTKTNVYYVEHQHCLPNSDDFKKHWTLIRTTKKNSCAYWPNFSLNPSIINFNKIKKLGTFDESPGHFEKKFAEKYTAEGYKTCFFDGVYCTHIGRLISEKGKKPNAYDLNGIKQF